MDIKKELDGEDLTVFLSGRLDTVTAETFEQELTDSLDGVKGLVIDCTKLDYVASAGLRVFLMAQKRMNKQGRMVVRGVTPMVAEVFSMTGFDDLLQIEE